MGTRYRNKNGWLFNANYSSWEAPDTKPGARHILENYGTLEPGTRPVEPPSDEMVDISLGQWDDNFLYDDYFSPACAAFDPRRRRALFEMKRQKGRRSLMINADQDDWGSWRNQAQPEWTAGGFRFWEGNNLLRFVEMLKEARAYGLRPFVGCIDQPTLRRRSMDWIIMVTRDLVEATHEHAAGYMLSWEIDEVWGSGNERFPNVTRWIEEVNWHDRDVGIHMADGYKGGFIVYGEYGKIYPGHVTRMMQFPRNMTLAEYVDGTRLVAEVAAKTDTKLCIFEHSGQDPTLSDDDESVADQRAQACVSEALQYLTPSQTGSMNGKVAFV